jgi:hypothetical protein
MKKLRLDADLLQVETFGVGPDAPGWRGTVAGARAAGVPWEVTKNTAKPDCDVSGSPTCGYTNCVDDTCQTCDYNTWCGESCILVCDAHADTVAVADGH